MDLSPANLLPRYDAYAYRFGYALAADGTETPDGTRCCTRDFVPVAAGTVYTLSRGSGLLGVWYDRDRLPLGSIEAANGQSVHPNFLAPAGAAYARFNLAADDTDPYLISGTAYNERGSFRLPGLIADRCEEGGHWRGKTIAWYGGSIPAGYPRREDPSHSSYPYLTAQKLGAVLLDLTVAKGVLRACTSEGDTLGEHEGYSFTDRGSVLNYEAHMLSLIGTFQEPDLFVLDYGQDDRAVDPYDVDEAPWNLNSQDTAELAGSYNYVLRQLFARKPDARVVLVAPYSSDTVTATGALAKLNELIETVGKQWGVPVCKLYERSRWVYKKAFSTNTLAAALPDGVHPGSDPTGRAAEHLADLLCDFLRTVH